MREGEAQKAPQQELIRFGVFEVNVLSGELRKKGVRVRLQEQPFQTLLALLERPGEVLTREELRQRIWPGTVVDYEASLAAAVSKVRRALGDNPANPRFIETIPRRGYRFLVPVDTTESQVVGFIDSTFRNGGSAGDRRAVPAIAAPLSAAPSRPTRAIAKGRYVLPWLLFGITGIALLVVLYFRQPPREAPLRRFTIAPPVTILVSDRPRMVAISPNGRYIAYAEGTAEGKLWLQDLMVGAPWPIDSTEGARGPFWSPDSRFIAFSNGSELKKVAVEGGQISRLCEVSNTGYSVGSWSPDGETIVFSSDGVIYEVPVRGGVPESLIEAETQTVSDDRVWGLVRSPHFLPSESGRRVLLFAFGAYGPMHNMMVQDLDSGRRTHLGPGALPFYSPTGHLVYQPSRRSRTLMALPFSLETLRATGEAFPIARDGHSPSVAADGTLAYLERPAVSQMRLVWVDRNGKKLADAGPVEWGFGEPDLSPDGRRVAVTVFTDSGGDVWVYDLARNGAGSPVTTTAERDCAPAWSPSSEQVAYFSNRAGNADILLRRADGTGEEVKLVATTSHELPSDWSRDGKYLLFDRVETNLEESDVWFLKRDQDGSEWEEPQPFLVTPFYERAPKLSPNGRYVAYVSDLSGKPEVYVESFPEGGGRVPISGNGGTQPRWSPKGDELFYAEGDTLMAVSVRMTPTFSVGEGTTLFSNPRFLHTPHPQYDVSNDGQRFIVAEPVGEPPIPKIRVVQNWYEEFRDREQN